jgi:hypothetical protein
VALDRSVCSEPQYRRRAAREMEAEDMARRPIAVDGLDLVRLGETALGGGTLLAALDGSYSALAEAKGAHAIVPATEKALTLIRDALAKLRPSKVSFVLDEGFDGADALKKLAEQVLFKKLKGEVVLAKPAAKALMSAPCVATTDAEVLDGCKSWFNLTRDVVEAVPSARVLKLQ